MIKAEVNGELDFDEVSLGRFLKARLGADCGTFQLSRISGGQSNPTYESIETNDRPGETRLLKNKVSKNSTSKAPTPQPEPEKSAYQKKSK